MNGSLDQLRDYRVIKLIDGERQVLSDTKMPESQVKWGQNVRMIQVTE